MANRYRFKEGFTHYEAGEPLSVGSIVQLTDKRFHSLRDRFELVKGDPEPETEEVPEALDEVETLEEIEIPDVDDDSIAEAHQEWIEEFESLTAKDACLTVAVIEDSGVLESLLEAESRVTVIAAIKAQLESLVE